ncbi:OLC1v1035161C3 [Oldenlandia corymbosa var. corymbosa]|uniref:WAT1-related protein n=1 Tax=Oldenlandia corymbosa var. corymbosa TaxID=529605 RepID=A0AAV1CSV1_OLDCO|nr:OLC1v1035161C3 [Oldenlandia corymbosa var. corymbosa]
MTSNTKGWIPTVLMVVYHVIYAWMTIFLKLAAHDGMDLRVAVTYRFVFGAVSMVPIAFFFERGALGQNLFLESLALTSATFASAMLNLMPATTFLIAVCTRLESVGWHTRAGKAKVFGTIIGIGGAMLFTFYKGPNITVWKTNVNLLNILPSHHQTSPKTQHSNQALGTILAFLCCASVSLWFIIQAKAAQYYPCPLSFTALMIVMALVLNLIATSCLQRDWNEWKLGWNIRLVAVAFSGIVGTTFMYCLLTIVIPMRGPLFVSAFNPLIVVIVAIVGSLILEEDLYLGSLLGGLLIICGLYIICWGKSKEIKMMANSIVPNEQPESSISSHERDKEGDV